MRFCTKHGISHKIYISSGWNCYYTILHIIVAIAIAIAIAIAVTLLKLVIQSSASTVANPKKVQLNCGPTRQTSTFPMCMLCKTTLQLISE
ncbi:hypothetical protein ACSBR1_023713 [Camellia fascicularis]